MDKDLQTPSVTTWLLAAVPVVCLAAYYNPAAEMAAGVIILGGGGIALYRVGRWAWARLMAGRGG